MRGRWSDGNGSRIVPVILTAGLLCLAGCTSGVNEQDGVEITALMDAAQKAIVDRDGESFAALFPDDLQTKAQETWQKIDELWRRMGGIQMQALTNHPQLERVSHRKHVCKIVLQTWFDYSRKHSNDGYAYHVAWVLVRHPKDGRWMLDDFLLDDSGKTYSNLISELYTMSDSQLEALGMTWEDAVNPAPLLTRTLQAISDHDVETLQACTVDGSLFQAMDRGIGMTKVAASDRAGLENRMESYNIYLDQINNIRDFSKRLRVEPIDLVPFFNAYSIQSMPERCSKLEMTIHFQGKGVPEFSEGLAVSWAAAYVKEKWLIETMYLDEIKYYEFSFH